MKNLFVCKAFAFLFFTIFLISCDKEYNTIGGDIVGGIPFAINGEEFDLVAKNLAVEKVQTNNLTLNQLGVYSDKYLGDESSPSSFSVTKANVVVQLSLSTLKPTFTPALAATDIDSVILTVPYFSTNLRTESYGGNRYKLDSIKGYTLAADNETQNFTPMDLRVYRNNYFLDSYDIDNNLETATKYYSTNDNLFSSNHEPTILNNGPVKENVQFVPDQREYVAPNPNSDLTGLLDTPDGTSTNVKERLSPRMRLHLDKAPFQQLISDAQNTTMSDIFADNNLFRNYFRGLYFEVNSNVGSLMTLNFSQGDVTIYYKQYKNSASPSDGKQVAGLTLKMQGATVNTFTNTDNYKNASKYVNNERIYLKGGQGNLGLIDLFTDVSKFEFFRKKNLIINDAAITFTIDKNSAFGIQNESSYPYPYRVYLFDIDNNKPLLDYYTDITISSDQRFNKFIHGGILFNSNNEKKYQIKITELIRKIYNEAKGNTKLLKDLTEKVRLGLVVSQNINEIRIADLKNTNTSIPDYFGKLKNVNKIPVSSVISDSGIILYGTGSNVPADKRMKFEINYTEIK